jgi:hypothetical protein
LGCHFFVSTNAENPENRKDAVRLLRTEYEVIAASMDTPQARHAAEDAFNAGPEVFRSRPLKRDGGTTTNMGREFSSSPARGGDSSLS